VSKIGQGRVLNWASAAWMHPLVLGPLGGLDDLVWRGLAWAARKPFVLRGLPPLVTMRVDDVAGRGILWNETPLYWVEEVVRHGFKPWLGLFIYNLSPQTVSQVRHLIDRGQATAFPHAFGRPPRDAGSDFFWYEDALPLRTDSYDEFIYFNHNALASWPDDEAQKGLEAVDRWYAAQSSLPMSAVALPHWYEMGANTCAHVHDRWNCEFIGTLIDTNLPLIGGTPWLNSGPFRRRIIGEALPHVPGGSGKRPVYYADFIDRAGYRFFNSVTEIRDDAGYEWTPTDDVEVSTGRAVRQLKRAMDSMAMASLFTHETDHIYKISPDHWRQIVKNTANGIAGYQPVLVTLDEGMRRLRDTVTARMSSGEYDIERREVTIRLQGHADTAGAALLFVQEDEEGRWIDTPAFDGTTAISVPVRG
jgi:hypothetical protein